MLEGLLQGKGDIDGLVVAMASLFAHHYGSALDMLIEFVRKHPRYVIPLFMVVLSRHDSVQQYAAKKTGNPAKVKSFAMAVRDETDKLVRNEVSIAWFNRTMYDTWMLS